MHDRETTEVTDRMLNLSHLYELLCDTFLITEQVKEILKKNCNEATFVLRPWQVKTIIDKEDEDACNCKKVANRNEAEKIAAEIDRTIILAQDLRNKLKLNVTSQKKLLKKKPIKNIYSSSVVSISNPTKALQKNIETRTANVPMTSDNKNSAVPENSKITLVATRKSISSNSIHDTKHNNATTNKTQSKTSLARIEAKKEKKERNFILENKLNVKKIIAPNKSQANNRDSNNISETLKKSPIPMVSATELSNLIYKVAQQSTSNTLISPVDTDNAKCPLHEDIRQSVQSNTIDVMEALQRFNVPKEIIKVLRTYNAFLRKIAIDNSKNSKENKNKKSVDIFLKEFEVMNRTMQEHLLQKSHFFTMAKKSISLFKDTFNENFDLVQLNDIKNVTAESDTFLKQYNIKKIIVPTIEKSFYNPSLTKGWMSNGIWNISCAEHFKNFSNIYIIRYYNKRQLLSLYEAIQKLQRIEYLNTLIEIILRDIIPAVRSTFEPTSAEYVQAYKMMFILHQGLNPEVPVLVRTD